jgi:osmotically-inducible protein OsmY
MFANARTAHGRAYIVYRLTGSANTQHESDKAAMIARNVAGVKSVDNDIHVK